MTKERRLKKEAIESCKFRGHQMTKFMWLGEKDWRHLDEYRAICFVCLKYVDVNLMPLPNQIEIGGTAVALGCSD